MSAVLGLALAGPVPTYTGRVTDKADLIPYFAEAELAQRIDALEASTGVELAVLTVDGVHGATPKQFATRVFNNWGVGKNGADNGVLFMVSVGDRRVEIETGYGIETVLTDARAGAMLDRYVIPRFKQADMGGGIVAGVDAIIKLLEGDEEVLALLERAVPVRSSRAPASMLPDGPHSSELSVILSWWGAFAFLVVMLLAGLSVPDARQVPWVAWGMWGCVPAMGLTSYINSIVEFQGGWIVLIFLFSVWVIQAFRLGIGMGRCPECNNRSVSKKRKVLRAATYTSGGRERITKRCQECSYNHSSTRRTAQLTRSSSSSSSSSYSSSSYSSSSYSSSSYSSSSSSSFGGGSSGGGGAGRSW